jgi:hypothetical protein
MWGAISYFRKTQLVPIRGNLNAARYRDEILQPHLLLAIDVRREIFKQDNARPHTARLTMDYLQNGNIYATSLHYLRRNCRPRRHNLEQIVHYGVYRRELYHLVVQSGTWIHR